MTISDLDTEGEIGRRYDPACAVCVSATDNAHWPMPGTHCRDCHRSWTSKAEAHVCHQHFVTNGVADRHWRAVAPGRQPGEHLDPMTVGTIELWDDGLWLNKQTERAAAWIASKGPPQAVAVVVAAK
jgi:hypothetical protein